MISRYKNFTSSSTVNIEAKFRCRELRICSSLGQAKQVLFFRLEPSAKQRVGSEKLLDLDLVEAIVVAFGKLGQQVGDARIQDYGFVMKDVLSNGRVREWGFLKCIFMCSDMV